ncbi:Homoprotocatechuate degradative operon repressor [Edwardsiella anguillarum ET080813]|nr:Homoprotocatechuate degradative operon repressor [Edwardsiella anguillarum ET080813]
MERDGLIFRLKPVNDQRKLYVSLSQQGQTLYEQARAQIEAEYQAIERAFSSEKMAQLTTLLEAFIALGTRQQTGQEKISDDTPHLEPQD